MPVISATARNSDMTQDPLFYQIAFSYLYRNRLTKAHLLLDHYGSVADVWRTLDEPGMKDALNRAQKEMEWIDKHQIVTYWVKDEDYPYRLSQCPDAPLLLYGKGNIHVNEGKMVSIVGTRDASDRGREQTHRLVGELKEMIPDVTIVSGLAYGIDVAAHKAALEYGLPTIIIPGHGLDRIYPTMHRDVAVRALENGGILTEYMSGTEPIGPNFVARDRIIAGMADAIVVMESKSKGGSLITAQMGLDYNRQVFAYPGRVTDTNSRGCNQLIRDSKAALVECAEDLVQAMMWQATPRVTPIQTELVELELTLSDTERTLLDKLRENEEGMHINLLVIECGISYSETSSALMMMEINGLVRSLPGGMYRAVK